MNLTNKSDIKEILEKYGARPEKWLGQHFILSQGAVKKMVEAAEIDPKDTILEIGPGLGTLTRELAKTEADIVAVEKDPIMIEILKETLKDFSNVKIVNSDARNIEIESRCKIVANLPYNAATFLIRQWLESEKMPRLMVLMVQKEVARRICSKPPRNSLLGLSVQFYADAKIIGYVPKKSFWPAPKVDSAIIKIVPKEKIPKKIGEKFFRAIKSGFSSPRKQLAGNLANGFRISKENLAPIFEKLGISAKVRAENLSLNQWLELGPALEEN